MNIGRTWKYSVKFSTVLFIFCQLSHLTHFFVDYLVEIPSLMNLVLAFGKAHMNYM